MSCRDISKAYNIGKTQAANVLKDEKKLRAEYENFQGKCFKHRSRGSDQKFKAINDIPLLMV